MLKPFEWLSLSRQLLSNSALGELTDARLRRAVSTAYYAVFHMVLGAADLRFMGPGLETSAGYGILYRSFDHHHIRTVCDALYVSSLKGRYKIILRRDAVSQDIRDFARACPALQAARDRADYDPTATFVTADVATLVDEAETAMVAFSRATAEEQADVLALMMVRIRD